MQHPVVVGRSSGLHPVSPARSAVRVATVRMLRRQAEGRHMSNLSTWRGIGAVVGALALAGPAHAASSFFSDFESGQLTPWLTGTTGGAGSTSVTTHNSSKMATIQHTGGAQHSLSYDFDYTSGQMLSFDLNAIAIAVGTNSYGVMHAAGGVEISFRNQFNVVLGTAGIFNATNPAQLPPNTLALDEFQHSYSATLGSFADLAGVASNPAISKVSMNFVAWAQGSPQGSSYATVWFDNVSLSPVPELPAHALMWAGLGVLGAAFRRARTWQNAEAP